MTHNNTNLCRFKKNKNRTMFIEIDAVLWPLRATKTCVNGQTDGRTGGQGQTNVGLSIGVGA